MKTRKLGTLDVSALGFGCMGISEFYGDPKREAGLITIRRAVELGVNFFDTADGYGYGSNEELLAEALKDTPRDKVIIATKCGMVRDPSNPTVRTLNTSPAYIKQACESSLKRLNTDYIDLFYLHRLDGITPIEDSMNALVELMAAGKIRHIGLSEVNADTIRRAHAIHPITAIQSEYSLWSRGQENAILPLCHEFNIGFVAYSPLGRGFLTGQITSSTVFGANDFRHYAPRFAEHNLASNLQLVTRLETFAKEKNCSVSQLALAWLLAKNNSVVPIPGTTKVAHLENNVNAVKVDLSSEDVSMLDKITAEFEVHGERYPEQTMKQLNLVK